MGLDLEALLAQLRRLAAEARESRQKLRAVGYWHDAERSEARAWAFDEAVALVQGLA